MLELTFQSSSNCERSSGQYSGGEILCLVVEHIDYDWGALCITPVGQEDAVFVATQVRHLQNADKTQFEGHGWEIRFAEQDRKAIREHWPMLEDLEGCTYSRLYVHAAGKNPYR